MKSSTLLLLLVSSLASVASARIAPYRFPAPKPNEWTLARASSPEYAYKTRYFTQETDHFSFRAKSYRTFQQRYLINNTFWDKKRGAIYFYAGNEGPIDWFAQNTGYLWHLARKDNALVVFAEHRFYGESMPDEDKLGLLTAEQALADFAVLLTSLKLNLSATANPVIAWGGSYGGMLAAWMRLQYPHIIAGAVASSAPILWFEDLTPVDSFERIVTDNFRAASKSCVSAIKESWGEIDRVAVSDGGLQTLAATFGVCNLTSPDEIKNWLAGAFANIAMVNYPYPTNFLAPLPANPISALCKAIDKTSGPLLQKIRAGADVFYNFSGQAPVCYDLHADPNGEDNWGFQYCTEMTMPMESNPKTSMFPPSKWNLSATSDECEAQYGVRPRPSWVLTRFGGRNISQYLQHFGSNIVFTSGSLDPWTAGCVTTEWHWRLPVILIDGGAHHLDLRAPNPKDPRSVIIARREIASYIHDWVSDAWKHARGRKEAREQGFEYGIVIGLAFFGMASIIIVSGKERMAHRVFLD